MDDTINIISDTVTEQVLNLAKAISVAEGFGADPNNVPTRAHNPGDLKIKGFPTTGDENISIFPDDVIGWDRLYYELNLIRSGASQVYSPNMTFTQFARLWTDTSQSAWLDNVLKELQILGYTVNGDTFLRDFFTS